MISRSSDTVASLKYLPAGPEPEQALTDRSQPRQHLACFIDSLVNRNAIELHIRMFPHEPVAPLARDDKAHEADVLRPSPLGNLKGSASGVASRNDRIQHNNQSARSFRAG